MQEHNIYEVSQSKDFCQYKLQPALTRKLNDAANKQKSLIHKLSVKFIRRLIKSQITAFDIDETKVYLNLSITISHCSIRVT